MAQSLATDEEEKKYFNLNARTQITLWGDIDGDTTELFDYAWKEWSGLIKGYYYPRWEIFYNSIIDDVTHHRFHIQHKDGWVQRNSYRKSKVGKEIEKFEQGWIRKYEEYDYPISSDVIPTANELIEKYNIR